MARLGWALLLAWTLLGWVPAASAQLSGVRAPLTEVARARVHADRAVERYGLDGRGATLCLVDTGVDVAHDDLRDAADGTRVRWMLDAFEPPRGAWPALEESAGGAVWRGDELGADAPVDRHGHGTAMASIALGDGAAPGAEAPGPTAGLAPGASMIVVRAWDATQGGFPDEAVVRGVRFCREAAQADETIDASRLVILLALGGHEGAHDGRDAFSEAVVDAAHGVPVVVAAGNDGERAVRAAGRLFAGEIATIELHVPRAAIAEPELTVSLHLEARGDDAAFAVVGPDGARTAWHGASTRVEWGLSGAALAIAPIDDHTSQLVLRPSEASGVFRIEVRGPAVFDAWLARARVGPTFFRPSLGGRWARADERIAIPATAPELIAVGSSVARASVSVVNGEQLVDAAPGERAPSSSIGPSADGAPKPDLLAPGEWILAALGRDVDVTDPESLVGGHLDRYLTDDLRVAVRGSSAAAAVVAGALLLGLELDASRAPEARALLIRSASDGVWTKERGWGELDVGRLLDAWSTPAPLRGDDVFVASRPYASTDRVLWITGRTNVAAGVLSARVGDRRAVAAMQAGAGELAIAVGPALVGSTLEVRLAIDGRPIDPVFVPVVIDRGPPGAVAPAGGGCATSAGSRSAPSTTVGAAALAVALLLSRRRRRCRPGPRGRR